MYLITVFVKSFYYWENNIKYLIDLNISCSIKFDYIFLFFLHVSQFNGSTVGFHVQQVRQSQFSMMIMIFITIP
jgi:hypothetical protein